MLGFCGSLRRASDVTRMSHLVLMFSCYVRSIFLVISIFLNMSQALYHTWISPTRTARRDTSIDIRGLRDAHYASAAATGGGRSRPGSLVGDEHLATHVHFTDALPRVAESANADAVGVAAPVVGGGDEIDSEDMFAAFVLEQQAREQSEARSAAASSAQTHQQVAVAQYTRRLSGAPHV